MTASLRQEQLGPELDVDDIARRRRAGATWRAIADDYGVPESTLWARASARGVA